MTGEACNLDRRVMGCVFPIQRLLGMIRMAFDLRKLIIAALGLALLQLGWMLLDRVFPGSSALTPDSVAGRATFDVDYRAVAWNSAGFREAHERLTEPFWNLLSPLMALFDPRSDWPAMLHATLALSWLFVVWGFCGGAICRIAVVGAGRMEQTGVLAAIGFARRNATSLMLTPFIPLGVLALCGVVLAGFGVLYRIPWAGGTAGGVLFAIPLGLGVIMTLVAVALAASWPLLQAAVAAGAEDALDALSRSFSYVNQRLGSIMALTALAWLEGMVGIVLMNFLVGAVLRLAEWGLGLSAPAGEIATIFSRAGGGQPPVATAAHSFWLGIVSLVAHGWAYSFFWTAAAMIYLVLRHDVDGTPWEEIDPPSRPPRGLITESLPPHAGESEARDSDGN